MSLTGLMAFLRLILTTLALKDIREMRADVTISAPSLAKHSIGFLFGEEERILGLCDGRCFDLRLHYSVTFGIGLSIMPVSSHTKPEMLSRYLTVLLRTRESQMNEQVYFLPVAKLGIWSIEVEFL